MNELLKEALYVLTEGDGNYQKLYNDLLDEIIALGEDNAETQAVINKLTKQLETHQKQCDGYMRKLSVLWDRALSAAHKLEDKARVSAEKKLYSLSTKYGI